MRNNRRQPNTRQAIYYILRSELISHERSCNVLLSVVVPMYNESEGVNTFHNKILLPELKKVVNTSYEIVYVNDGSTDDTLKKLQSLAKKDKQVKVVCLSRNFGKEIATTAGLHVASGDATIIMDGDGQHPPTMLTEFVQKWQKGFQVVIGIRETNQKEGLVKKWGSKVFYQLFNLMSGSNIVPRSTDFRLIDRVVREEFKRFSERQRITRGLIDWLGFKRAYVSFHAPARFSGEASYKTSQLIKLAVTSFISLSLAPLFFFGWVGIFITFGSLIVGIVLLIEQLILGDPLHWNFTGAALLGIFTSFLIGLVLTSQGIIAVYLSHVHGQTQDRPLFVIDPTNSENL